MLRMCGADVDFYVCGFPCCPYSKRRVPLADPFKDAKAKPFFATVKTIAAAGPRSFILENVEGLEQVYTTVRGVRMSCLQFIMQHLGSQLPPYMICIVPPALTSPHSHGSPINRPREYILGVRQGCGKTSDEDAFCRLVHSVVEDINGISSRRAASWGITSFLDVLSEPALASEFDPAMYSHCGCCVMASCPLHPCKASNCHCASGRVSPW